MKREWIRTALASIGLMSVVGCASISDIRYESTQKARAVKQYAACGKPSCEKFPHDYKLGWLDGFYTVSTGGPECPPAVAPARYWNVKQQIKDCDGRRRSYYSGWQDGAARAVQFPDTHHLKIFETCECTVPRCDLPCVNGQCEPCGAGMMGAPVHEGLIEMSQDFSYEATQPLVPPAPAAPFDTDGDRQAKESEDASEKDSMKLEAAETSQASAAADTVTPDSDDFVLHEDIATEELLEDEVIATGRTQLVQEHDADSLFGSAFDLTSSRHSMVEHQASDPIATIDDDALTEAELSQAVTANESAKVETPMESVENAEQASASPSVSSEQDEGFIVPVKPPTIVEDDKTLTSEVKVRIEQQQPQIVLPKPTIKQVDSAPVQRAEEMQLTKRGSSAVNKTVPVVFEMIESDTDTVQLAK